MKRRTFIFCFTLLFFLGCQTTPESADAEQPEGEPEVTASSLERPDPNNPAGENNAVPEEWLVRLDQPDSNVVIGADQETSDIFFVNMAPGYHITSGPAAIYYHPASTASGTYEASTTMHLFDPGDRTEAFGILVGGSDLQADNQAYDYFLIRNSGEYLIKRRRGSDTELIQDWTPHESIVRYTPDAEDASVANTLAIRAGEENVVFSINGAEVATYPRDEIKTDGIVGLRVNHALNVHVSDLSVSEDGV